jgi:membrane dipeptidase
MAITRREALKGLAVTAFGASIGSSLPSTGAPQAASSEIDGLISRSIVIDDLSGFEPKPSLPGAGFSIIKESGITMIGPTLGDVEPGDAYTTSVASISKMLNQIAMYPDRMMLIRGPNDVEQAKKQGKLGVLINFQNSAAIGLDLKNLDTFYDMGLRQIQLTFNWRNWVGDGCTERTQAGLSYFGVDMVHRMNELGMLVDVSHTGYQSTLDAIEVSKGPIVFSHANCKTVCDHPRNKTDDQIKALAAKGGVMGLTCFNWFVSNKPISTLDDVLDHYDYMMKLVGADHIGIGSDFNVAAWAGRAPDAEWEQHMRLYGEREAKVLKSRFPPYIDAVNGPQRYRVIAQGLRKRGFSTGDIEKILGLNFLRVYKQVLKPS